MRLVCPRCGLKGTADGSLYERKVKCPDCDMIFSLSGAVLVETVGGDRPDPVLRKKDRAAGRSDTGMCVSCGFHLSYDYLVSRDNGLFCQVCAAAGVDAEAAS